MKVRSIAANQTEIGLTDGSELFVSYETPVAAIIDCRAYRTNVKYSKTTTRHINKWLDGVVAIECPQAFFDNLLTIQETA